MAENDIEKIPRLCEKSSLELNPFEIWVIKTGLTWAETTKKEDETKNRQIDIFEK